MKNSTFFIITISIVSIASITLAILFLDDFAINASHVNPIIPENDLYCGTEWNVQLKEPVAFPYFEKILRNEIAEFGSVYDISQRKITLHDIGDNRVRIVIGGLWYVEPGRPNLEESIKNLEFVDYIEDFVGGPVIAWCQ